MHDDIRNVRVRANENDGTWELSLLVCDGKWPSIMKVIDRVPVSVQRTAMEATLFFMGRLARVQAELLDWAQLEASNAKA